MTEAGERGPHGDHGQTGSHGAIGDRGRDGKVGEQGDRGRQGVEGERGRQGDSGQVGAAGSPGPAGPAGPPGESGTSGQTGELGRTGKTGVAGPSSTRRLLIMFIFVVLIFVVLALRIQANTAKIADNSYQNRKQSCANGKVILEQFNQFARAMSAVERRGTDPKNSTYDKSAVPARRERIKIYKSAIIDLPDCSKITRP